jgi:hypothetical protein
MKRTNKLPAAAFSSGIVSPEAQRFLMRKPSESTQAARRK